MLSYRATEAALPSLLGMALDYAPEMDGHDVRRKIGIITEAEICMPLSKPPAEQRKLVIGGFLYAQDFPMWTRDSSRRATACWACRTRSRTPECRTVTAAIWTVTKFMFTGAAVLRRDKAAYPQTWIKLGEAVSAAPSQRVAAKAELNARKEQVLRFAQDDKDKV